MIAKMAAQLGSILASPSGSEDLGPAAQKGDRGGDKAMEKADYKGLEGIAKKLANCWATGMKAAAAALLAQAIVVQVVQQMKMIWTAMIPAEQAAQKITQTGSMRPRTKC
jgi:hypothetical protein